LTGGGTGIVRDGTVVPDGAVVPDGTVSVGTLYVVGVYVGEVVPAAVFGTVVPVIGAVGEVVAGTV